MSDVQLRETQAQVVAYSGGKLGVAAVPGSGKTFTLSYLAALLVEKVASAGGLDEQEVLIVTLTNSAVNTFRRRIANLLQQDRGLLPYVGYRVRTLHGLAHDIVRMRPGLVGLSENFEIVDERVASAIMRELSENWVRTSGDELIPYLGGGYELADSIDQTRYFLRSNGPVLIESIAREAIRLAKDRGWAPEDMRTRLDAASVDLPLARIGIDLYEGYQRGLGYRGAVDFDDLVRYAMEAFSLDSEFLNRLQARWPYILEDEAQDSSKAQDDMLRHLSQEENWVRVGDPNQSIFTTFTTANANILRQFIETEEGVTHFPLPESGRSAPTIIKLANYLLDWTQSSASPDYLSDTFYPNDIKPTRIGDPQPNPTESFVYIDYDPETNITPDREIGRVVTSLERWLPDHAKDWTVAVLVPQNTRGFKVAEILKEKGIPYEELLRSTSATRDTAARLQFTLDYLSEPTNGRSLSRLFREVWWPRFIRLDEDEVALNARDHVARALFNLRAPEDFLWPGPEGDWVPEWEGGEPDAMVEEWLSAFAQQVQLWLEATLLPIDQLLLTIAGTLFDDPTDIALAHKIAVVLRGIADNNPEYRLPDLTAELRLIAQNERRFLGFDDASEGYEPKPGVVTIATMHAAKGLEWDRVYLMSVNNYSFPIARPGETFIAEKWFIRDDLNMEAEAIEQLGLLMDGDPAHYVEGRASKQARIEYAKERLRLLYVGITRARKDLIITWNMGRMWDKGRPAGPSDALVALKDFWEEHLQ